jgi:hypothetical protein
MQIQIIAGAEDATGLAQVFEISSATTKSVAPFGG